MPTPKRANVLLLVRAHGLSTRRLFAAALSVGCTLLLLGGCGEDGAGDAVGASADNGGSVSLDGTSKPPWPAPTDVAARVASAGLDMGPMGMAEHYHPTLQVIVNGEHVVVPANIGVDPATGAMSALHTHESDGTIHIEADKAGEVFTLGQLFTEWGVKLTPMQIGGVRAAAGERISVMSNGEPVAGDPRNLRLEPEQAIVLEVSSG